MSRWPGSGGGGGWLWAGFGAGGRSSRDRRCMMLRLLADTYRWLLLTAPAPQGGGGRGRGARRGVPARLHAAPRLLLRERRPAGCWVPGAPLQSACLQAVILLGLMLSCCIRHTLQRLPPWPPAAPAGARACQPVERGRRLAPAPGPGGGPAAGAEVRADSGAGMVLALRWVRWLCSAASARRAAAGLLSATALAFPPLPPRALPAGSRSWAAC